MGKNMGKNMELEEFVRQQNVKLYRKLLEELPTDSPRRETLAKLLAAEKAKEKMRNAR